MRILSVKNPRFPGEGSSALGKSGPKARPRGVVDGQQVDIPAPDVVRTVGTQDESVSRERKARSRKGERKKSSEAHGRTAKKSRYCVASARTVNRHRWMRRES